MSIQDQRPLRVTCEQCRAMDRYAIEILGTPGVVLMENAGRNAADEIERFFRSRGQPVTDPVRVAVVCGRGNNGGDGFVIARHLVCRGYDVSVDLAASSSSLAPDAGVNYAIARNMGVTISSLDDGAAIEAARHRWQGCQIIVDALLGTGFAGEVREPLAGIIHDMNAVDAPMVVAVDVPSGLDADRGTVGNAAIRADLTVTFLAEKAGFSQGSARPYVGHLVVVDIGVPADFIARQLRLSDPAWGA